MIFLPSCVFFRHEVFLHEHNYFCNQEKICLTRASFPSLPCSLKADLTGTKQWQGYSAQLSPCCLCGMEGTFHV